MTIREKVLDTMSKELTLQERYFLSRLGKFYAQALMEMTYNQQYGAINVLDKQEHFVRTDSEGFTKGILDYGFTQPIEYLYAYKNVIDDKEGQFRSAEIVKMFLHEETKSMICLITSEHTLENKPDSTLSIWLYCPKNINDKEFFGAIFDIAEKNSTIPNERSKEYPISFVHSSSFGWEKKVFNLKPIDVDVDLFYEDIEYDLLTNRLMDDGGGVVILDSEPGTGKSFLIKKLALDLQHEKEFIYLTAESCGILTDQNFINFVSASVSSKGGVFVIEDAENILKKRDGHNSGIVSTILNMSDGILSDLLKCKFILTFNNSSNVDPALLRAGRLLFRKTLGRLSVDKSNAVAKQLGKEVTFSTPQTLAEVFNYGKEVGRPQNKTKSIGFKN